jgi:hypothetical protein
MVLKLGHFGNLIRSTWKVLKFVAVRGWISAVPIMLDMKRSYKESRRRGIFHVQ